MVTDIHCHFIPDELFKFVQARKEFDTCVTAMDGERIDLTVRGMHFGLNPTFFEPARQVADETSLGQLTGGDAGHAHHALAGHGHQRLPAHRGHRLHGMAGLRAPAGGVGPRSLAEILDKLEPVRK